MVAPVTVQTVSSAADLLLIVTAGGLLLLLLTVLVQTLRRRWRSAAALTGVVIVVVAAYGTLLLGFGLTSTPRQLLPGDAKCFDDWCAAMLEARGDGTSLQVRVQLQNRGRGRAMRSLLARAYLEGEGAVPIAPEDGRVLQAWLQPGQQVNVDLAFPRTHNLRRTRFVIVEGNEGSFPSLLEIGGEGSPFHARAGWSIWEGGTARIRGKGANPAAWLDTEHGQGPAGGIQ